MDKQRRPRILFDAGTYLLNSSHVTGIGLRILELAQTLSLDFDVRIFSPLGASDWPAGVETVSERTAWPALLRDTDAVYFVDMGSRERLEDAVCNQRVVITESSAPIEHLQYPSILNAHNSLELHDQHRRLFQRQLEVSHHFVCRSRVEQATLAANLCMAGRLAPADIARSPKAEHLISFVPIGFSDASARRAQAANLDQDAPDFVWTGGLWSFYDPLSFVDALALCRQRDALFTAAFLHARPLPDTHQLIHGLRRRIDRLGLNDTVALHSEPLDRGKLESLLKSSRAAVCIGRPGIENATCVRLRIRDSRLYGLPLIVDRHGGTAVEAVADGFGHLVAGDGPEAIADTLMSVRGDRNSPRSPMLSYSYEETTGELISWLRESI